MVEVVPQLYVGGDADYEKIKDKQGWSVLRTCKEGPGGHRDTLGYTTPGAPKGPDYLAAPKGKRRLALNFIDPDDPNFIPLAMVKEGIAFVENRIDAGDNVLVACNQGHSRGPTTAMLFLRSRGELSDNFITSERIFRTLCPQYEPGIGVRQFAKQTWSKL